jgi:dUTP pyrophosphatase
MYDTVICLEIPNNYYVEIVPRSSIIKSGFILSNNIGIIDASYKGNLYVCLTKTNLDSEITLPFKCCQLIIRKQEFPIFKEIKIEDIIETKRGEGGFGSTD